MIELRLDYFLVQHQHHQQHLLVQQQQQQQQQQQHQQQQYQQYQHQQNNYKESIAKIKAAVKKFRANCSILLIFTLRPKSQGGNFDGTELERINLIKELLQLKPDYFDLEYDVPWSVYEEVGRDCQIITSYHNFMETPKDNEIESIYRRMYERMCDLTLKSVNSSDKDKEKDRNASKNGNVSKNGYVLMPLIKICTMAKTTNDALRMLQFIREKNNHRTNRYSLKENNHRTNRYSLANPKIEPAIGFLGMCMGELGQITRILGNIYGAPWVYAAASESEVTAPGQLAFGLLRDRYRVHLQNENFKVYGLIGNPVTTSISDETHNRAFSELPLSVVSAVYVKMCVKEEEEELSEFFRHARTLRFSGLSVTMPLKELVAPFLDRLDEMADEIGAVNTIVVEDGDGTENQVNWVGYNTDGIGAMNVLGRGQILDRGILPKNDQTQLHIVILGAGGAAKAIAYEALKRGVRVTIVNRDQVKAKSLANRLGCEFGDVPEDYHVMINATPVGMPIDPAKILPGKIMMEIKTRPKESEFTEIGKRLGCLIVYGYDMFINQAEEQFRLWGLGSGLKVSQ